MVVSLLLPFFINRMPLKSIQFSTPYERLFKQPPDLSHLKVFGCLCYISTFKVNRSKFDPKTDACFLLGYPPNQKAYKVLNLVTKKSVVLRDVVFHEHHFHFSNNPSIAYSNKFFLPIVTPYSSEIPYIPAQELEISNLTAPLSTPVNDPILSPISLPQSLPNSPISSPISPPAPRKSTRSTKPPSYLNDFVCQKTTKHCKLVAYDNLPVHHKLLIVAHMELVEPTSYTETATNSKWIDAMDKDISALKHN